MFERPAGSEAALLVGIDFGDPDFANSLAELERLAASAGATVVGTLRGSRHAPDPRFFIGSGKVEELEELLGECSADLVIFNHELSPAQQRNLEGRVRRRVIDRTDLILDIFAQRARTSEGKLQVELAQLEHLATRLVRGWTHLERQRGGIGLRGPGETQLETDRRLLGERVKLLKARLARLLRQRGVQRRGRERSELTRVSLVGYTNAGKSTLFNRLTRAQTLAADKLFATLDTTTRRLYVPEGGQFVVSDTVGFIRDLPHTLVAAFRATLEETARADVLLHVVDASSPARDAEMHEVGRVLREIGADRVPQVVVFNKIDAAGLAPGIERDECGNIQRVRISARSGAGIDLLRGALVKFRSAPSLTAREFRAASGAAV